jgi:hypothetical protein
VKLCCDNDDHVTSGLRWIVRCMQCFVYDQDHCKIIEFHTKLKRLYGRCMMLGVCQIQNLCYVEEEKSFYLCHDSKRLAIVCTD